MILTGGKQLSVYDPTIAKLEDAGSNFYITEAHIGKMSRAEASIGQLKELNPLMDVNVIKGPISKELVSKYNLVFVTEMLIPVAELIGINEFCRKLTPAIGFIVTMNLGLYGFTFVDLGPKFIVKDATGESPSSYIMVHVMKGNPGIVRLHEDKKHSYSEGDYVKFREVEGMTELNSLPPTQIKVIDRFSFSICDTSGFGEYTKYLF